jgi:hypothetical protein
MKGRKERKHREEGGRDLAEEDVRDEPEARTNAKNIDREAEEKKRGGRAKRMRGGHVHHEKMEHLKHAKHVGLVHGEHAKHHAGRKPRKDGGRTGSNERPFSSAHKGELPPGRKDMMHGADIEVD